MGIRILVLGAQGQLGYVLGQHAKPALMETMSDCVCYGRDKVDFTQPDQIVAALKDVRPDVVINAAAYTQVEKAEQEPQLASQINGTAVGVLGEQCKKQGAVLVHYSTDYVFDGTANRPYLETDPINPLSAYGRSKAEGEQYLQEVGGNWLVFRTGWVYAQRGGNFCKTMIKLAQQRPELKVVNDQRGAPTPAAWLAELGLTVAGVVAQSRYKALGKLAPTFLPDFPAEVPSGEIFHASATGETTWHEYATLALELAAKRGLIDSMPAVLPVPTSSMNFAAPRPAYSVLDNAKLRDAFRVNPPDWAKGVRNLLATLEAGQL